MVCVSKRLSDQHLTLGAHSRDAHLGANTASQIDNQACLAWMGFGLGDQPFNRDGLK